MALMTENSTTSRCHQMENILSFCQSKLLYKFVVVVVLIVVAVVVYLSLGEREFMAYFF